MIIADQDYDLYLIHYGTPRHSGRYPWGSGENPYQRNANFRAYVIDLRHQGLSDTEIAKGMGMTRNEMIAKMSRAHAENRAEDVAMAKRLVAKGYSKTAIGRRMGINESQVRSLLRTTEEKNKDSAAEVADILKKSLKEQGGFIDVGLGTEQYVGASKYVMQNALARLKEDGYNVHSIKIEQMGTGNETKLSILTPGDVTRKDVYRNLADIRQINQTVKSDTERSSLGLEKPVAIDPKRVMIRFADDIGPDGGKGIEKDGVIELRRGVDDISLGAANYAQVRINVGDTHYLKGMAVYSDDMPDGV